MSGEIEIVADPGRLEELADAWRTLAERRSNAFLTPEWFFAWMRTYGDGVAARVVVRHDRDGHLAGVLPLVGTGRGPLRRLRFAGALLGDVFHPLDLDDDRGLAIAAVARLRAGGERGTLVLDKVDDADGWVHALAAATRASVTEFGAGEQVLPEVEIAGVSWDEYLAGRSRNLRSQLGRRRRRLEREHEVVFRQTDPERLERDLEAFVELHRGRWAARGGSGALDAGSIAFHRDFSAAALERGWLRLWVVEVDGSAAAAWYGWRIGDRYTYYLAGFDERFSDYSIGMLLLAHTIETAIAEGAAVYELLLGDEDFKLRFATGERRVQNAIVSPRLHPLRYIALADAALRRNADRLEPQTRARLKRPLRVLADRLPTSLQK